MDDEQSTIPAKVAPGRGHPGLDPKSLQAIAAANEAAGFPPPAVAKAAAPTPPADDGEQQTES